MPMAPKDPHTLASPPAGAPPLGRIQPKPTAPSGWQTLGVTPKYESSPQPRGDTPIPLTSYPTPAPMGQLPVTSKAGSSGGATFPGQAGNPNESILADLTKQLEGLKAKDWEGIQAQSQLGMEGRAAQGAGMQDSLGRSIKGLEQATAWDSADVATQTGRLQQATAWDTEDVALQTARLRGQAPLDLMSIEDQASAKGGRYGKTSQTKSLYMQQLENQLMDMNTQANRAGAGRQDQVTDLNTNAYRSGWGRQEQVSGAKAETQRALEALSREDESARLDLQRIERANQADALEGKYKTLAQADDANRSEATAWTRSRANQLMAAGVDQETARSTAIIEARSHWSNVDPTFIDGVFTPSEGSKAKPKRDSTTSVYGKPVSSERGSSITPERANEIHLLDAYDTGYKSLQTYLQMAGSQATAAGFLEYEEANFLKYSKDPEAKSKDAKANVGKWAELYSLLLAEAGLE